MARLTDRELAVVLTKAQELEHLMREQMATEDLAERDAALNVLRLAKPLCQKVETWIALRALRAQLQAVIGVQ